MKKISTLSFLIEDAIACNNADEAIFLYNLRYWIEGNRSHKADYFFHEGRYWTYKTLEGFHEQFPFWSIRQLERITKNLEEKKFIIRGNFNKRPNDKTIWYTLNEEIFPPTVSTHQTVGPIHQTVGPTHQTVVALHDSTNDNNILNKYLKNKNVRKWSDAEIIQEASAFGTISPDEVAFLKRVLPQTKKTGPQQQKLDYILNKLQNEVDTIILESQPKLERPAPKKQETPVQAQKKYEREDDEQGRYILKTDEEKAEQAKREAEQEIEDQAILAAMTPEERAEFDKTVAAMCRRGSR